MGFRVGNLGFGFWSLQCGLQGSGSGDWWGLGFRVQGLDFRFSKDEGVKFRLRERERIWGSGCRVQGSGSGVWG